MSLLGDRWRAAAVVACAAAAVGLVTLLPVMGASEDSVPVDARREVLASTCGSYVRRTGHGAPPADDLARRFATVPSDEPAVAAVRSRCRPDP